jgi:hypothetical protein
LGKKAEDILYVIVGYLSDDFKEREKG